MPILKNPKHEKFCQARALGKTADQAYKDAGYKRDRSAASRLSSYVNIMERIEELLKTGETSTTLTLQEKRQFCADVMRTPIDKLGISSHLVQEFHQSEFGTKIKMPDKLAAIKLDNDMAVEGAEAGAKKALEIIIKKF